MIPRFIVAAAVAILLTGCEVVEDSGLLRRYTEEIHQSHPLKRDARITLETMNGSVEILGWEKEAAEISGEKYASREDALRSLRVDISASPDALRIRAVPPTGPRGSYGARFTLRVPSGVTVDRLVTSNGSVRLEDLEGPARVVTSNGAVRAYRLRGFLEAETSNGSIEVRDATQGASLRTSNGRIMADRIAGRFDAETSNGSIEADLEVTDPHYPLRLRTSNGALKAAVRKHAGNEIELTTSNGSIRLALPEGINANLSARTSNSRVQCELPLRTQTESGRSRLEGVLGNGGPRVDLKTSNGSITITRSL